MKLLACDFDGTLYQNKTITEIDQRAIKQWQIEGNLFVIATGRDYTSLLNKLISYEVKPDYIIGNNGATIDQRLINKMAKVDIEQLLKCLKTDEVAFQTISLSFYDSLNQQIGNETGEKLADQSLRSSREFIQLAVQLTSPTLAEKFAETYQEKFPKLTFLHNIQTVDIVSPLTDKAKALEQLVLELDLKEKEVYTIGDGLNDLGMLCQFESGTFPWVGPEVLAAANHQVSSVSDWVFEIVKK